MVRLCFSAVRGKCCSTRKAPSSCPGLQQELNTQQFLVGTVPLSTFRAAPARSCCVLRPYCRPSRGHCCVWAVGSAETWSSLHLAPCHVPWLRGACTTLVIAPVLENSPREPTLVSLACAFPVVRPASAACLDMCQSNHSVSGQSSGCELRQQTSLWPSWGMRELHRQGQVVSVTGLLSID